MFLTFAPLEGITNQIYRQAHARFFPGIDRYYSPFITPTQGRRLTTREMTDVDPENNRGVPLVPQLLTNNAEDFLWCAQKLRDMGYDEVNLNLGCPSGTVFSKGKGSGLLREPERLRAFLCEIAEKCPVKLSVKTRIGVSSPEEFGPLLEIFRALPLCELIVHPRTREQLYKGEPHREAFAQALAACPFPVSYNGNLFSVRDVEAFRAEYPQAHAVMLGRGLIANPGLVCALNGQTPSRQTYKDFADAVLEGYLAVWRDQTAVAFHLKEMWAYMISLFPDSAKHAKAIRKANSIAAYRAAVDALFADCELSPAEDWSFRRL
ncbi:MAG: tRNA-dihydrouridine synthase family protein [Eubacteriales bacterium]|nr:tRNA-dihydrouridine synthase family protein [Eubacteriales bacterium]